MSRVFFPFGNDHAGDFVHGRICDGEKRCKFIFLWCKSNRKIKSLLRWTFIVRRSVPGSTASTTSQCVRTQLRLSDCTCKAKLLYHALQFKKIQSSMAAGYKSLYCFDIPDGQEGPSLSLSLSLSLCLSLSHTTFKRFIFALMNSQGNVAVQLWPRSVSQMQVNWMCVLRLIHPWDFETLVNEKHFRVLAMRHMLKLTLQEHYI